jgi:hypothetical protein
MEYITRIGLIDGFLTLKTRAIAGYLFKQLLFLKGASEEMGRIEGSSIPSRIPRFHPRISVGFRDFVFVTVIESKGVGCVR